MKKIAFGFVAALVLAGAAIAAPASAQEDRVLGHFLVVSGGLQKEPTGVQYVGAALGGVQVAEKMCWAAAYEKIAQGYDSFCSPVTESMSYSYTDNVVISGVDIRYSPKANITWPEL